MPAFLLYLLATAVGLAVGALVGGAAGFYSVFFLAGSPDLEAMGGGGIVCFLGMGGGALIGMVAGGTLGVKLVTRFLKAKVRQ
jgi:hypothetical protein